MPKSAFFGITRFFPVEVVTAWPPSRASVKSGRVPGSARPKPPSTRVRPLVSWPSRNYSAITLSPLASGPRIAPVKRSMLTKCPPGGTLKSVPPYSRTASRMNSLKTGTQSVPP